MSLSPGAQTLHGLSANHKPGFSASAALQSGAAETERDRGHWGRHTQVKEVTGRRARPFASAALAVKY